MALRWVVTSSPWAGQVENNDAIWNGFAVKLQKTARWRWRAAFKLWSAQLRAHAVFPQRLFWFLGVFFFCQVWWFELKTPFYINTINETHHKETVCIYIFSASRCEVTCLYNVRNMNHSARSIGAAIRIWSLWLRTVKFVCHKVLNIICCDGNV